MKIKINKKIAGALLTILGIVLAGLLLLKFISIIEKKEEEKKTPENAGKVITPEPVDNREIVYVGNEAYALKENLETFLVMGIDKFSDFEEVEGYNNSQQVDFIVLLIFDHENKSYSSIQLNRDTMVDIIQLGVDGSEIGTVEGQLALSHTYGSGKQDSCMNTLNTVSRFMYNIKIDHYISITMDGIELINDQVGGVTLELMDDFTHMYPDMVKGTTYTLMGEKALAYVRGRMSMEDPTNIHRMERQRQYMAVLKNAVIDKINNSDTFVFTTLGIISETMLSDCTVEKLSQLANDGASYKDNGLETISGESVYGEKFMEFYVDENDLMDKVLKNFYDKVEE